jgi:hypothetical protein
MRKAQTWSLETTIAIGVFVVAIIVFYALVFIPKDTASATKAAASLNRRVLAMDAFADGIITDSELVNLSSKNCSELKKLFGTSKKFCIYIKDEEGNLINITNDSSMGIGCGGLNLSGYACGKG